ncbi:putative protein TPRXL [Vidua chalybeata]|uniref:putative protein TPRXL n=1 Tax=Vidua chalybeata TaxID=81927 RepID=UPI0023A8A900|nr:putative protein TPRXL [Vidua chalybeata]
MPEAPQTRPGRSRAVPPALQERTGSAKPDLGTAPSPGTREGFAREPCPEQQSCHTPAGSGWCEAPAAPVGALGSTGAVARAWGSTGSPWARLWEGGFALTWLPLPVCLPRPWELLLCSSCAAEGTHRRCSGLRNRIESWECDSCAGVGTASRDESELSGPSLTRQSGLEPAHGSSAPEAISPSSSTLVPSGLDPQSPSAETSSSHQHTVWLQSLLSSSLDTSSPSTSSSTYSTSSDPEDRVHCRRAGPGCRPTRSRQQGRAPEGPVRWRSRCDRSRRTTTRTERPRPRETPSQASPRRSRARQQGQAQSPPARSRSRRDRSSRTRPRTERPRRRETSSGTSCRHSHARLQRRAWNQPVLSRSRQDRSSRTAARAQRPRRSGAPSGMSRRSNRSRQRRRASTGTYNSST